MSQLPLWLPSTSSAEASRAKTSPLQALALALVATARDSGISSIVSSASSAPNGSSLRTSPAEPADGSTPWCLDWDSKAMRRYRSRCRQRTLARHTAGRGSSWSRDEYPTPTAARYGTGQNGDPGDGRDGYQTKGNPSLHTWASRWATPVASDHRSLAPTPRGAKNTPPLREQVGAMVGWPTPTATDSKAGGSRNTAASKAHPGLSLSDAVTTGDSAGRRDRSTGRGGIPGLGLSPRFVEALMGFPDRWTEPASEPSVTASSPSAPRS